MRPADRTSSSDPYATGHGDPAFHVAHYDLDLTYRVAPNRLRGTATLDVEVLAPTRALVLDLVGLAVERVEVTGAPLVRHDHRGGRLTLRLGRDVGAGTRLTVTVRYGGTPRPVRSPWGEVGWEELEDGAIVASQPTGAPSWFPCNDRPDDRATYRTALTVDTPYRVLAHGRLVGRRTRASTTTWVHEEDRPTATYLATVQVGRYEELVLGDGAAPQRALVPAALVPAVRGRLAHHDALLSCLVDAFGPYPFAGYTLVCTPDDLEIPVEAQGAAVFGANHLTGPDADDRLVAHELAHQWFGNSVGLGTWQDIWLNEGFACWAEWWWSQASGGPDARTLARTWHGRLAARPQDLVLTDPGYDRIFDDRVYKRGALTLEALRAVLGTDAFLGLLRAWTSRYGHATATTDDLRALAAEHAAATGGDALARRVADLLVDWLDRPALPPLPAAG
ncbi:M1 family metallopeptidase [Cellulomonas sp. JZ18]|uniref:M1 family metallopeptidase n=1 Tax=Cellulomonas sp. JZ18 TaxID=2654191 RepID=UPI0018B01253|nr:M1 family metallopeptidase [Cellulomonas sp. JZ18]